MRKTETGAAARSAQRASFPQDPRREGWVYYALAANPHEQRVKIGFSTTVRLRAGRLRAESIALCRQAPTILGVEAGTLTVEAARQDHFHELRISGEWFRYETPLIEFIRQLNPDDMAKAMDPISPTLPSQRAWTEADIADWVP